MNIKMTVDDFSMVHGFKSFKLANNQAVRNTLNKAAGFTRNEAIKEIKKDFTLRNTFTVRSVVYDKATQKEIKDMQSSIGALKRSSYMATQETGGLKKHRAKGGQTEGSVNYKPAIPMQGARDGDSEARPVSTLHYVQKIKRETVGRGRMAKKLLNKSGGTAKSRSVAQMYIGKKYNVYVKRNDDIFAVKSFLKTGRNSVSAQLEHLYTIHYGPIQITKHTWLQPSYQKASRNLEAVYRWELKRLWKEGNFK
jgi:hypothetical protein